MAIIHNAGCTLESPGELENVLKTGSHCLRFCIPLSGVGMGMGTLKSFLGDSTVLSAFSTTARGKAEAWLGVYHHEDMYQV